MTHIKLAIQGSKIALLSHVDLVAGTIGQKCQFFFDDAWKNLNKTIVYRVGGNVISSDTISDTEVIIPPKVLAVAGLPLEIGITGQAPDNSILYPTTWCPIGFILPSAYGHAINNNVEIIYDGGVIV